jgi:hypothetical protein
MNGQEIIAKLRQNEAALLAGREARGVVRVARAGRQSSGE